jgi:hypothetical protein
MARFTLDGILRLKADMQTMHIKERTGDYRADPEEQTSR